MRRSNLIQYATTLRLACIVGELVSRTRQDTGRVPRPHFVRPRNNIFQVKNLVS